MALTAEIIEDRATAFQKLADACTNAATTPPRQLSVAVSRNEITARSCLGAWPRREDGSSPHQELFRSGDVYVCLKSHSPNIWTDMFNKVEATAERMRDGLHDITAERYDHDRKSWSIDESLFARLTILAGQVVSRQHDWPMPIEPVTVSYRELEDEVIQRFPSPCYQDVEEGITSILKTNASVKSAINQNISVTQARHLLRKERQLGENPGKKRTGAISALDDYIAKIAEADHKITDRRSAEFDRLEADSDAKKKLMQSTIARRTCLVSVIAEAVKKLPCEIDKTEEARPPGDWVIIFCNEKDGVERTTKWFRDQRKQQKIRDEAETEQQVRVAVADLPFWATTLSQRDEIMGLKDPVDRKSFNEEQRKSNLNRT